MRKIKFLILMILTSVIFNSCFALWSASQAGTGRYCGIYKCPKEEKK